MNRVETITFVYNEEFLLPFYLRHYAFVDRMNIIYDTDSVDGTLSILQGCAKVNVIPFTFPDAMDNQLKVDQINRIYKGLLNCWVFNVDCDEFIFFDKLPALPMNSVALHNVFRHHSEGDLKVDAPIKKQRRYGFLDPQFYIKPVVVRSGLDIQWAVGNHNILGIDRPFRYYDGAHWANADPCFTVKRRAQDRTNRISVADREKGYGFHKYNVTEQSIIEYLEDHENERRLW